MRVALIISILALTLMAVLYISWQQKPATANTIASETLESSPAVSPITTPLEALMQQQPELAMTLMERNTPVDETNRFGDTALIWSVNLHQRELMIALLERGADPNHRGSKGRTALHWAARVGNQELSQLLMEHGARPEQEDERGETPLFLAARANHGALVNSLIKGGAPLEHKDRQGDTALACAVRAKAGQAITSLLKAGANPQQQVKDGTILALALRQGMGKAFQSPELKQVVPQLDQQLQAAYSETVVNQGDKPNLDLALLSQRIHLLINRQRSAKGLSELSYDQRLEQLANTHSQDMSARAFFGHVNPDGETPTSRATRLGLPTERKLDQGSQLGVAENIFRAHIFSGHITQIEGDEKRVTMHWYTVEQLADLAVESWMRSPGHRQNILTATYGQEGIGIFVDEKGGIHITQNLL